MAALDDESKALFTPGRGGSCRGLEADGPATGEVGDGGGGGGAVSASTPDEDLGRGGSDDEDFVDFVSVSIGSIDFSIDIVVVVHTRYYSQ